MRDNMRQQSQVDVTASSLLSSSAGFCRFETPSVETPGRQTGDHGLDSSTVRNTNVHHRNLFVKQIQNPKNTEPKLFGEPRDKAAWVAKGQLPSFAHFTKGDRLEG